MKPFMVVNNEAAPIEPNPKECLVMLKSHKPSRQDCLESWHHFTSLVQSVQFVPSGGRRGVFHLIKGASSNGSDEHESFHCKVPANTQSVNACRVMSSA